MNKKGFTLIELMITISILMIITGWAFPSFQSLKQEIRSDIIRTSWIQFLNLGRSSAVQYQSVITICPTKNNECVADYTLTWSMFTDSNKNKKLDSNEILIRSLQPDKQTRLKLYPEKIHFFRFYDQPTGIYSGLMKGFTICPTGYADRYASHLTLNIMGRVSASREKDTDEVPLRMVNRKLERVTC